MEEERPEKLRILRYPPNENGGGIKMGQRGFINLPVGGEREIMETTCHFAVESQTLRGNLEGEILRSD